MNPQANPDPIDPSNPPLLDEQTKQMWRRLAPGAAPKVLRQVRNNLSQPRDLRTAEQRENQRFAFVDREPVLPHWYDGMTQVQVTMANSMGVGGYHIPGENSGPLGNSSYWENS